MIEFNDFKIEDKKLYWLIKASKISIVMGLIYNPKHGVLIIGGPTGTHITGHSEKPKEKILKLLNQGYIIESVAKKEKTIKDVLIKPKIDKEDLKLIELFKS
jgi:hypothetical protein